jgi:hypothetical protein
MTNMSITERVLFLDKLAGLLTQPEVKHLTIERDAKYYPNDGADKAVVRLELTLANNRSTTISGLCTTWEVVASEIIEWADKNWPKEEK